MLDEDGSGSVHACDEIGPASEGRRHDWRRRPDDLGEDVLDERLHGVVALDAAAASRTEGGHGPPSAPWMMGTLIPSSEQWGVWQHEPSAISASLTVEGTRTRLGDCHAPESSRRHV